MYKLVAIDLDGTLLNNYGVVTENTKKVIKEALKKDIYIILASGRPIDSIKTIANEIGANKYFIAGNGALIYDMQNQIPIYEKYMSKEKVLEIIKICEENSISYNIYTENTIITKALKYNVLYYHKENLKKEEKNRTNITLVNDVKSYIENLSDAKFLKITICDESKSVFQSILKKVSKVNNIDILDVSHMSRKLIKQGTEEILIEYFYTEISLKDVDKWEAIKFLINKLNIDKSEVIAIGDNINDKRMIKEAGLGIAMKESSPDVIEIADYITDRNNEEGVANAINRFILS